MSAANLFRVTVCGQLWKFKPLWRERELEEKPNNNFTPTKLFNASFWIMLGSFQVAIISGGCMHELGILTVLLGALPTLTTRYWTMFGCLMALMNSYSCSKAAIVHAAAFQFFFFFFFWGVTCCCTVWSRNGSAHTAKRVTKSTLQVQKSIIDWIYSKTFTKIKSFT